LILLGRKGLESKAAQQGKEMGGISSWGAEGGHQAREPSSFSKKEEVSDRKGRTVKRKKGGRAKGFRVTTGGVRARNVCERERYGCRKKKRKRDSQGGGPRVKKRTAVPKLGPKKTTTNDRDCLGCTTGFGTSKKEEGGRKVGPKGGSGDRFKKTGS